MFNEQLSASSQGQALNALVQLRRINQRRDFGRVVGGPRVQRQGQDQGKGDSLCSGVGPDETVLHQGLDCFGGRARALAALFGPLPFAAKHFKLPAKATEPTRS